MSLFVVSFEMTEILFNNLYKEDIFFYLHTKSRPGFLDYSVPAIHVTEVWFEETYTKETYCWNCAEKFAKTYITQQKYPPDYDYTADVVNLFRVNGTCLTFSPKDILELFECTREYFCYICEKYLVVDIVQCNCFYCLQSTPFEDSTESTVDVSQFCLENFISTVI